MNKIIALLFVLGLTVSAGAQTITITDNETNSPVEQTTLMSRNPLAFATTNSKGQADISTFKNSENIEIRSIGYKTLVKSYFEIKSEGFKIKLEASNLNLDEVVVSATRWWQVSDNVSSKIVTVSPKEVNLQNPQTAADLLEISGNVFIQKSQQGGGSPMIRGFATNRLIYTVDGVRMNTAIFRAGNIQNVINLDPFATENTEVLFGPGSGIYGSDAIGGVMSFQTLTPRLSLDDYPVISGKAVTRYSSANNEKTGHFDVSTGWKKWAFVTSFSSWDFDHLKQGNHGPDDYIKPYYVQRQDNTDIVVTQNDPLLQRPSGYKQINLMQKLRFKPDETWDFTYGFHYSETSPYGRYDRHNRVKNGTARYAEWDYGPQFWMMNNLNISYNSKNALFNQMTLRLAQQKFEESRIDRSLNKNDRNTTSEKVDAYSANLDFTKYIGNKHILFYGLEMVKDKVLSEGKITDISTNTEETGPSRYPESTWSSFAVYLNDEFQAGEKFTVQAGLHYNRFKLEADFSNNLAFYPFPFTTAEINNGALTGSFGSVYRPSGDWVIKAGFGTAFRSPNVDDIGKVFDSEPGSVVVPNPDLKAEYAYSFDLGIAKVFSDAVKIDLTGYYTILNNALVRRDFQLNGND
ncbi:MAG: TonB-dependent receptor, partial [Prolixibacteraceae bacterium]|nr:TonB-dependent receptor [Prolixibacteraceae bacterium]